MNCRKIVDFLLRDGNGKSCYIFYQIWLFEMPFYCGSMGPRGRGPQCFFQQSLEFQPQSMAQIGVFSVVSKSSLGSRGQSPQYFPGQNLGFQPFNLRENRSHFKIKFRTCIEHHQGNTKIFLNKGCKGSGAKNLISFFSKNIHFNLST